MADIEKCRDDTCPSRNLCWRYLAPSSSWQSWMAFDRSGKDSCDDFWPVDAANKTGGQHG